MGTAPTPADESARLEALYDYQVLDTLPEAEFDEITRLAAAACETPVALVSLVDTGRQWFKSSIGLDGLCQTDRKIAFCSHAILAPMELMEVPDATLDERFADNPLVVGEPGIRFYAGRPIVTPAGYPIGTLCVIDTEPRQLTDAQRETLERLARLVVALLEGRSARRGAEHLGNILANSINEIYVVEADSLVIKYANNASCANLRYARSELIGRPVTDILDTITEHRLRKVVRTLRDGSDDQVIVNSRHLRRDGSSYPVETRLQYSGTERPPVLIATCYDVTEQQLTEAALRDSESRFRALYNQTPVMLHSVDPTGRITSVSEYWLEHLGYTRAEVMGRRSTEFLTDESRRYARKVVLPELFRTGECWNIAYQMSKKDGTVIDVSLSAVAHRDRHGDFAGSSGVSIDVTERNRVQRELEEAQAGLERRVAERTVQLRKSNARLRREVRAKARLQQQFLAVSREMGQAEIATGVLHNVGNVLNSLNVAAAVAQRKVEGLRLEGLSRLGETLTAEQDRLAEFLADGEKGRQLPAYVAALARHLRKEQRDALEEFRRLGENIEHVKRVIAQQQDYARKGALTETADLASLADEVLALSLAEHHGIEIERRYEDVGTVQTDKHRVLQILINLVNNAKQSLQEMPFGERRLGVRIDEAPDAGDGGRVRIEVEDNGQGIEADNLTRVFAYGFTTRADGHGFGLHASANTARELGGSLGCRSDGRGKGATFTLELPREPAEPAETVESAAGTTA